MISIATVSLSRACQVSSGHLLAVVSQHYQPVAVLRFTDDGTHFISGGADARVIVWSMGRYVCVCVCVCDIVQKVFTYTVYKLSTQSLSY